MISLNMANLNIRKRKEYLGAILQLGMRSRVSSRESGVHKSRLPTSDHKRWCSFTHHS